ncbi:Membrane-bound lytic murein transglycosylase B precursor [Caenispirillum salinarum AK4]|uniref:Membrane-bound lytic murein transglycosylase B n=1 Tax=Caenispirillum salinarum AK4 TaxID=1238182 RepID=K9HT99_9PROT|nr:lytic murein transglycosylase [Caenispirillum salinarum]EKV31516.1 Membrane-bound lytic murein transglycosylase B precursor [Caenispirillum salinarum AK4]
MPRRRLSAPAKANALTTAVCVAALTAATAACAATPTPEAKPGPQTAAPAPAASQAPTVAEPEQVGPAEQKAFAAWLDDLRSEARERGIGEDTLAALSGVEPLPRVLELDRSQPEFTQTFFGYVGRLVNDRRIEQGRERLRRHADLLREVEARYGVPARFIVAFWGLETNYGATFGGFPVLEALATLAWDTRRSDFFRRELLTALEIIDAGHIPADRMIGSWAGAMGHMQFMPTTFAAHATDATGDGRIDIWGSLPDAFASAANYLTNAGWNPNETWGREVRLPDGFDYALADGEVRKPLAEWAAMGLTRADGRPLPVVDGMNAALILPGGARGPAFLIYENFDTILDWNRSTLYAIAVGHLADRLVGLPPIAKAAPPDDRPLSRAEVMRMQTLLNDAGFPAGEADGVVGSRTRAALRAFQTAAGLPPDGYPSAEALAALETAASRRAAEVPAN